PRRSLGVGGPFAWLARALARDSRSGFAPRTPPHALSRAAPSPRFRLRAKRYGETSPEPRRRRAVRLARSRARSRFSQRLRPSDSPTRSLARRSVAALPPSREALRRDLAGASASAGRSPGSLARSLAILAAASPLGLPLTPRRAPLRRRASAFARSATARPRRSLGVGGPFAWLARALARDSRSGFAPRTPPHTSS